VGRAFEIGATMIRRIVRTLVWARVVLAIQEPVDLWRYSLVGYDRRPDAGIDMGKLLTIFGCMVVAAVCGCARSHVPERPSSTTTIPFHTAQQQRFADRALNSPNEAIQAQGADARRNLY